MKIFGVPKNLFLHKKTLTNILYFYKMSRNFGNVKTWKTAESISIILRVNLELVGMAMLYLANACNILL